MWPLFLGFDFPVVVEIIDFPFVCLGANHQPPGQVVGAIDLKSTVAYMCAASAAVVHGESVGKCFFFAGGEV